jgi:hypothetical protein
MMDDEVILLLFVLSAFAFDVKNSVEDAARRTFLFFSFSFNWCLY